MVDFQPEKNLILRYYRALDSAHPGGDSEAMTEFVTRDFRWKGYAPFGELQGPREVGDRFWGPLKSSFRRMQRRQDVFFAGKNQMDDFQSIWVVSMGHLMGLFDETWLGIRPTRKLSMLRYCEFNLVADGRITEAAMFFDIPHLMAQAGQDPFGPQTGAFLVHAGPMPHSGLLFDPQQAEEGEKTLATINAMIGDLGQWKSGLPLEDELARTWHDDMVWWGPHGIGATYTIQRYAKQHSGPFRAAFADRSSTGHVARLAEGNFGGFFGWPNFTARHLGGFMGMPATRGPGEFRVIDIYRRDGDKLAENWVFIDLLHFWQTQGVDILARATEIGK